MGGHFFPGRNVLSPKETQVGRDHPQSVQVSAREMRISLADMQLMIGFPCLVSGLGGSPLAMVASKSCFPHLGGEQRSPGVGLRSTIGMRIWLFPPAVRATPEKTSNPGKWQMRPFGG